MRVRLRALTAKDEKGNVINKRMDREGVDMTQQVCFGLLTHKFLSLRRKKKTEYEDTFDHKFDVREFLENKRKIPDDHEIKSIIAGARKGRNQQLEYYQDSAFIENLVLVKLENLPEIDNEEFRDKCLTILNEKEFEFLNQKISIFSRGKLSSKELFNSFCDFFGELNAFEMFSYYIKSVENPKLTKTLDHELFIQCQNLKTIRKSILKGNSTYLELFQKLSHYISENICRRFHAGIMSNEKSYKKDSNILFQFIGILKAMHMKEILKFKYLSNFLEDDHSIDQIHEILFLNYKEIDQYLNKIPNRDILMCFLYFNLAVSRLDGKVVVNSKTKLNPNLNKLFLRHFPEFAKEHHFRVDSEDEDYNIPVRKHSRHEEEERNLNILSKANMEKIKNTFHSKISKNYSMKVKDVFVSHQDDLNTHGIRDEDLTNKYDFPTFGGNPTNTPTPIPAPATKKKEKKRLPVTNAWAGNDLYIYTQKGMSKKEMNELFPTLGDEDPPLEGSPRLNATAHIQPAQQGWGPAPTLQQAAGKFYL